MSELPTGWAWSTIGELAPYIQRGKSPKYAERSELPVVNQKCIRWTRLEAQHLKFIHPEQFDAWDAARRIQPGDVLWNSTGTGTVGRAYLVQDRDCKPAKVVDSHVTIVRPSAAVEPRYLFSWIRSAAVQDKILEMCDGTTNQIELSRTAIAETMVPVAPAPEQTRIADQLDTLLARIQACQDRLEAVPALLKRFRKLVLSSALSGQLTEAWRGEQGIGLKSWSARTIADVAEVGTGSTPLRSNSDYYAATGTPWVTSAATGRPYIDSADQYVTKAAIVAHRLKVYRPGTLIVAMYGEGKTRGQVVELRIHATINQACAAITVDQEQANAAFVKLVLQSQYEQTRAMAEGGAQPNLNLSKVRGIPLPLPPRPEQDEIVLRVGELFAFADRVESRVAEAAGKTRKLPSLTLAKAFRGELVPQDPNNEPASALLARIAAQRNAPSDTTSASIPRRSRPPRAPKESATMTKSRQDEDVMGQPYLAGHLRRIGKAASAEALFRVAELPVADFYKQLAWEVAQGLVKDNQTTLEPGHAAG